MDDRTDTQEPDLRDELKDFGRRHNLSVRTICNRALGYTDFMERRDKKNQRERGMIKKLRSWMDDFEAAKSQK